MAWFVRIAFSKCIPDFIQTVRATYYRTGPNICRLSSASYYDWTVYGILIILTY